MENQALNYNIKRVEQNEQDCLQVSVMQLLNYYGVEKTVDQIKKDVPVQLNSSGEQIGSSNGQMGQYLLSLGFNVTIHTVDVELFDRSWSKLNIDDIVSLLVQRAPKIKHTKYSTEIVHMIAEGYADFIKTGGKVELPVIDEDYLYLQLKNGPYIALVSWDFLNDSGKAMSGGSPKEPVFDSINGYSSTHAVVVSGYKDRKFLLIDSDPVFGAERWIESGLLVGSIYVANSDFDGLIMTLTKK